MRTIFRHSSGGLIVQYDDGMGEERGSITFTIVNPVESKPGVRVTEEVKVRFEINSEEMGNLTWAIDRVVMEMEQRRRR